MTKDDQVPNGDLPLEPDAKDSEPAKPGCLKRMFKATLKLVIVLVLLGLSIRYIQCVRILALRVVYNVSNYGLREASIRYLEVEGPAAGPALVSALGDENADIRRQAADALGQLGPKVRFTVPALLPLMADDKNYVRLSVAWSLGQIAGPEAFDGLVQGFKDKDQAVRIRCGEALKDLVEVEAPKAVSESQEAIIVKALSDEPEWGVREAVVEAIAALKLKSAKVRAALEHCAKNDPDDDVKELAEEALEAMPKG